MLKPQYKQHIVVANCFDVYRHLSFEIDMYICLLLGDAYKVLKKISFATVKLLPFRQMHKGLDLENPFAFSSGCF